MTLEGLWAEIESELKWRVDEIRFFKNLVSNLDTSERQDQYRRALILLLYAHFEGFTRFAFAHYIRAVNQAQIKCGQASHAIAASTLSGVFASLRNPNKKCDLFRRTLPDETHLHRFARDREFLEQLGKALELDVCLSDGLADAESNLKPEVLQKILYRLGLPHDSFDGFKGRINKLLNYRNRIAHGESKEGISQDTYNSLQSDVFYLMNEIKSAIVDSVRNRRY
ncbi:MAG: MAE_28990/MAE_18760 family HEPN-like nuclease, partial [Planctomycetota bacterium]